MGIAGSLRGVRCQEQGQPAVRPGVPQCLGMPHILQQQHCRKAATLVFLQPLNSADSHACDICRQRAEPAASTGSSTRMRRRLLLREAADVTLSSRLRPAAAHATVSTVACVATGSRLVVTSWFGLQSHRQTHGWTGLKLRVASVRACVPCCRLSRELSRSCHVLSRGATSAAPAAGTKYRASQWAHQEASVAPARVPRDDVISARRGRPKATRTSYWPPGHSTAAGRRPAYTCTLDDLSAQKEPGTAAAFVNIAACDLSGPRTRPLPAHS